jgi:hypothetical protein
MDTTQPCATRTLEVYNITVNGSVIEAKQKRIGGPIYRCEVNWSSAEYKQARRPMEHAVLGHGAPALSLVHSLEGGKLSIGLHVAPEFTEPLEFWFTLAEVKRTEADTLREMLEHQEIRLKESHLLGEALQLEVEELKARLSAPPVYMAVSSQRACGVNENVQWNHVASRVLPQEHFTLSADFYTVTVIAAGLYEIDLRLSGTNMNGNGNTTSIRVGDVEIAHCVASDQNNHQLSHTLREIRPLEAGAQITIKCGFSGNSLASATYNRLTIRRL